MSSRLSFKCFEKILSKDLNVGLTEPMKSSFFLFVTTTILCFEGTLRVHTNIDVTLDVLSQLKLLMSRLMEQSVIILTVNSS